MVTIKSVDRETLTPSDLETYRTLIRPSALPLLDHQAAGTQLILIEARDNQTIVGLALAKFFSWNSAAELFSLFVREDKRQKGIGLKLFQALQDTLIQKGCIALGFQYESTSPFSIAIDKILAHLQWPPATLSLLRCYFKAAEFKPKWLQIRPKLPRGMTIFPWKKLKSAERFVIECQAKQEAFHASISPF
jgi:GNAT superfamily N-acetyltransferase